MGGKKRLILGVVLLILLAAANRLWFILELPLMAEEIEMLHRFIVPGWQAALTDYSSPHNHVLHSLLARISMALPLPDVLALRVTALLASLASALIVFRMVLREQSARFAFFAAAVWMGSLGALYSGSVARGHALVAFFALTAYYAYLRIDNGAPGTAKWSAVFVLACALGFLTVPTFVLPFIAITLTVITQYLLTRKRELALRHGINLGLAVALAVVFYLPVLLNNPITALTDNFVIREYDLANFTLAGVADHARSVLSAMDALIAGLFIPFAFIAIWLQREWKGPFMSQAVIMVLVSFGYVGLAGKLPPPQTLVFVVPFIIMAVAEGLHNGYHQVSQRYRKAMMVLLALLPVLVLINSNRALYGTLTSQQGGNGVPNEQPAPLPTSEDPIPHKTE
ncbi:MAG: glycosyltransferase family 39 protein [Flavobacteriales bacterium]|nr:glycosyltransferase family 39 protein [Flavobacteriales bacterium]